jgi:hypothetical protein
MSLKDKLLKRKEQVDDASQKLEARVQAWFRALTALIHFIENTLSESIEAKLLSKQKTFKRSEDGRDLELPMLTLSANNIAVTSIAVTIEPVGVIPEDGRVDIKGGVIVGKGYALLWDGAGQAAPENWKIVATNEQGKPDQIKATPLTIDTLESALSEHLGLEE